MLSLEWPRAYLKDPSFSLFRPLTDLDSPWRESSTSIHAYFNGQARRVGGHARLRKALVDFLEIVPSEFSSIRSICEAPLVLCEDSVVLLNDLTLWLGDCFVRSPLKPWANLPEAGVRSTRQKLFNFTEDDLSAPTQPKDDAESRVLAARKADKKRLVNQELRKRSWKETLALASEQGSPERLADHLLEIAIKGDASLMGKVDTRPEETLATHVFAKAAEVGTVKLSPQGWTFREIPVFLGRHYISTQNQRRWFAAAQRDFQKIVGSYARWQDAKVLFFTSDWATPSKHLELNTLLKKEHGLQIWAPWIVKTSVSRIHVNAALLLPSGMPDGALHVYDWEFNVPRFDIELFEAVEAAS